VKNKIITLTILLVVTACTVVSPTANPTPTATSISIVETPPPATEDVECLETFEARPIQTDGEPRTALSAEEWEGYLNLMGIQSLCVPVELGAPFLNADWDSAKIPATGRMVSIGFERLYHGEGWSDMFLLYSTYDFTMGTEFDHFATLEDRDALRNHSLANEIQINGISGFIRFKTAMSTYEGQPQVIYRTAVFPFEDDYVAVVYNLGAFAGDVQELIQKFEQGDYPAGCAAQVEIMDFLVNSLRFQYELVYFQGESDYRVVDRRTGEFVDWQDPDGAEAWIIRQYLKQWRNDLVSLDHCLNWPYNC